MSMLFADNAVSSLSGSATPHMGMVDNVVRDLRTGRTSSGSGLGTSGNPGFFDAAAGYLDRMNDIAAANSAASAAQAAELRSWQERQNKIAMDFNAAEAAKNRDWQQMMSNTAHQREVADLVAAGLNPVLSATGGNGAAVTSGATASGVTSAGAKGDVDTSANQSIASLLGTMLTAQTNLMNTITTAQNNMAIAEKNNAMSKLIAEMNNSNQFNIAKIYESLGMFQSLNQLAGTQFSANRSYEATALAALYSLFGTEYMADMNYKIQQDFPNTWPSMLERFLSGLGFGPFDLGDVLAGLFGLKRPGSSSSASSGSPSSASSAAAAVGKYSSDVSAAAVANPALVDLVSGRGSKSANGSGARRDDWFSKAFVNAFNYYRDTSRRRLR